MASTSEHIQVAFSFKKSIYGTYGKLQLAFGGSNNEETIMNRREYHL